MEQLAPILECPFRDCVSEGGVEEGWRDKMVLEIICLQERLPTHEVLKLNFSKSMRLRICVSLEQTKAQGSKEMSTQLFIS